jgi:hypothetical protein
MKRFWDKVQVTKGCWTWLACKNSNGYGTFTAYRKTYGAHRFSYELHFGEIPKGMCVLHSCDNRLCVNPGHLFIGTHSDNHNDMYAKKRCSRAGENNGRAKLSNKQIKEIQEEYSSKGTYQEVLASKFKVSASTVSYWICKGKLNENHD